MKSLTRFLLLISLTLSSVHLLFAQWVTNGPYGGGVTSFAVSGTNLFAGTSGGVFLSTDYGTSWSAVNTDMTNTHVNALAVSGTNLFAGTEGGVFLSTNNGTNWTEENSGITNTTILSLAVSGSNLFAGTNGGGVFLSTNNGTSWNEANNGLTYLYVTVLTVSGTNIFAGTSGGGAFLSADNGASWNEASNGLPNGFIYDFAVSDLNLFAATGGGVFYSTDNGSSWTVVNNTNTAYALDVSGTSIFAGIGGSVFHTTNNGIDWTEINDGLTESVLSLVVFGLNIFAGTYDGGVWLRPLSEIITSVEQLSGIPTMHFFLSQNYPNPFNPATIIEYSLDSKQFVTLKVYDLLGNEIETLVNEEKPAGTYELSWDAEKLSGGVYFYKIQMGDPSPGSGQAFTQTRKMILLK